MIHDAFVIVDGVVQKDHGAINVLAALAIPTPALSATSRAALRLLTNRFLGLYFYLSFAHLFPPSTQRRRRPCIRPMVHWKAPLPGAETLSAFYH